MTRDYRHDLALPVNQTRSASDEMHELTEQIAALVELMRERPVPPLNGNSKPANGTNGAGIVDWPKVRTAFLVALLLAIGSLAFNSFLLARDTARDVAAMQETIKRNVPSPDVLRRLYQLEAWRERHTENGG
jgi:hypothetical protein